jgi:hypothetical protein
MIVLPVEQGTPEWEYARIGHPTASGFDEILTPAKLKLSAQRFKYRNKILAEWLIGHPIDWGGASQFMDRGTDMEPEARAWYELQRDVEVEVVGHILTDDRRAGGSPDGLVGSDGGIEVKCAALHTHVGYMLDPDSLVAAYRSQVQGYLWLTGRAWWDLIAYAPTLPKIVQRIEPDAEYHAALADALGTFCDELDDAKRTLADHREAPDRSPLPGEESSHLETLLRASLEAA